VYNNKLYNAYCATSISKLKWMIRWHAWVKEGNAYNILIDNPQE
jgi:hypothetical protein